MKKDKKNDLGIRIEPKEVAAWIRIKESAEAELQQNKRAIIIGEEIIEKAKRMIEEERKKAG